MILTSAYASSVYTDKKTQTQTDRHIYKRGQERQEDRGEKGRGPSLAGIRDPGERIGDDQKDFYCLAEQNGEPRESFPLRLGLHRKKK